MRTVNNLCCNEAGLVQKFIGTAYDTVKKVADNLDLITFVYDFLKKYNMLICLDDLAEVRALDPTQVKYVRVYIQGTVNAYYDYMYISGDFSGIIPDVVTPTGSWVQVASSLNSAYGNSGVPWVYNEGSAVGGEKTIVVDISAISIPDLFINGSHQQPGIGFVFDPTTQIITFADELEEGDEVVAKLVTATGAISDDLWVRPTIYTKTGHFATGGVITDEFQTMYSHTDEYGNEYWWAYQGSITNFPITVPANFIPDENWVLVISDKFIAPIATSISLGAVTAYDGTNTTYTVADTSGFTVGKYAFIHSTVRLGLYYGGVFKVVSKTSNTVQLFQSNARITVGPLLGAASIKPMNFVVTTPGGVTTDVFVKYIRGVVFDCNNQSKYGIRIGGKHNNTGYLRHASSVSRMEFTAAVNLSMTGGSSDDTVGILVGNGSTLGVSNVAVNGTKIGIETYRNGSLIGTGAYVYNATNDAFKAEFTCNNYLYYCSAIKCGSGFTSRYSAGAEYATIVCCDAAYGALAQFNGYCSVRDYEFYGMTSAGCYATQEGYLLMSNSGELVNCSYTYRIRKGGQIEQLTGTATDTNSTHGYDVTSGTLLLLNAQVTASAPNTWDGKGNININSTDHSIVTLTLAGTVAANGRQAWQAAFQFNFNETGQNKLRLGVRYSDSALPIGLLMPTPSLYNANSSRIYLINYTAAPITVSMSVFAYVF